MEEIEFGKKLKAWERAGKKKNQAKNNKQYDRWRKEFNKQEKEEKKLRDEIVAHVKENGKKQRGENRWSLDHEGRKIIASIDPKEVPGYLYEKKSLEVIEA